MCTWDTKTTFGSKFTIFLITVIAKDMEDKIKKLLSLYLDITLERLKTMKSQIISHGEH